jgi:hypothetical protein
MNAQPKPIEADLNASTSARVAAFLLIAAGAVTISSVLFPRAPGFNAQGVVTVGAIGVVLGLVVLTLPWPRWRPRSSLALVAPALALITFHNLFGGDDPYRYAIFFIVVFVWVGTYHPRGASLALAPVTVAAYLAPRRRGRSRPWATPSLSSSSSARPSPGRPTPDVGSSTN